MRLPILPCLVLLPFLAAAQKNYAPLNAEWRYEGHSFDCLGFHQWFRVEQEKEVQGKDCSVIYAYLYNNSLAEWEATGDSLVVWEEANKVYFLEDTSFYLLYDFSAEIGDTVTYYGITDRGVFTSWLWDLSYSNTFPPHFVLVVEDIAPIAVNNGQILKGFIVQDITPDPSPTLEMCNDMDILVENIGSTSMHFAGIPCCCFVTKGCYGDFICYQNAEIEYLANNADECDFVYSQQEVPVEVPDLELYPNPSRETLLIRNGSSLSFTKMALYHPSGQLLWLKAYSDQLDTAALPPGIYHLKLFTNEGLVTTRKVLKQ